MNQNKIAFRLLVCCEFVLFCSLAPHKIAQNSTESAILKNKETSCFNRKTCSYNVIYKQTNKLTTHTYITCAIHTYTCPARARGES